MKLEALTPELFAKALELYLAIAYDGAEAPAASRIDTSALQTSTEVLALFVAEVAAFLAHRATRAGARCRQICRDLVHTHSLDGHHLDLPRLGVRQVEALG